MTQTVTIAIPTYNRAGKFLRPAIECALSQSYTDLEIIISDNCSTDNTEELVSSFDDPRIRYFRQVENIGANNNFNFCVNAATGNYFLLFHDDDMLDPDFVQVCMATTEGRDDIGLIRSGTRLIDGDGALIREVPNHAHELGYVDFFRGWMKGHFTSYVCSTLFNTRLLQDIGGFQSRHGLFQDLMVVAKLIGEAGHRDVEACKASFRRHDENYGNSAELKAWCEDGRELAETIGSLGGQQGDALYQESMHYLCLTVYGYAARFFANPIERLKAYRMIDREFDYHFPLHLYLYRKNVRSHIRVLRRTLRNAVYRVMPGLDASKPRC